MCKSVRQIEAVFTRTSTSSARSAARSPYPSASLSMLASSARLSCLSPSVALEASCPPHGRSSMLAHGAIPRRATGRLQFALASQRLRLSNPGTPVQLFMLSFILPPFIHPHHLPRRRILLVQLRRFGNQPLHSRRFTSARLRSLTLRTPSPCLQQFSRIGSMAPAEMPASHALPQHIDAERSVRIKRGVFHGLTYSSQCGAGDETAQTCEEYVSPWKTPRLIRTDRSASMCWGKSIVTLAFLREPCFRSRETAGGQGEGVRNVRLRSLADVKRPGVKRLIAEAAKLNKKNPPSGRWWGWIKGEE